MARPTASSLQPYAHALLRIIAGFMFSLHGFQKMFGMLGGNKAEFFSLPWLAGFLELFGGLLLMLGLFTRPVAFILAGEMAVAYFMVHQPQGFLPILNRGELAALYCFVFLYFAAAGAGHWSLDHGLRRGIP